MLNFLYNYYFLVSIFSFDFWKLIDVKISCLFRYFLVYVILFEFIIVNFGFEGEKSGEKMSVLVLVTVCEEEVKEGVGFGRKFEEVKGIV